jgi:hypothetical protein
MMVQGIPGRTLVAVNLCVYVIASVLVFPCSAADSDCSAPAVLLNAFDKKLNLERDLRAEDLKVEADGKQVPILSFSFDTHARHIVLMVDSSGSVTPPQQTGWGLGIPAAAFAAYVLPASASAQLVTFSDELRRESSDFENRKTVQERVFALAKRQPKGRTSLFDSVHQAVAEFKELRFGDAIYVVTDGGDNKSRLSGKKVMEELVSRGIRAFVFLIQGHPALTEEEQSGASDMYGFAESTGGAVVRITSDDPTGREQLDNLAPQIMAQVQGVYRLELGISEVKKQYRVKVEFVDRDRKHNTRNFVYSQQIAPCPGEL